MDLKSDDIFNIELDPALILSYKLGELNLESIPNDIFEFPDETPEIEVANSHSENMPPSSEPKVKEEPPDSEEKSNTSNSLSSNVKSEIKSEPRSRIQKRKKDINGNEENLVSDENLHNLLKDLTIVEDAAALSDSDNETSEDSSKLKERAPTRPRRRANRSRDQSNILSRNEIYDRSQFSNERLRNLSGSSYTEFHDTSSSTVNQFTYSNDLTFNYNRNDSVTTLSSEDSLFENIRLSGVRSPESGYDSSIPGSPPRVSYATISLGLEFIPETVDEQNVLDFLAENSTDCALPDLGISSAWDLERESDRINDIKNFLIQAEVNKPEVSAAVVESVPPSENLFHEPHVPSSVGSAQDLTTLPAAALVPTKTFVKNAETPKKIVYKKLDDKAKNALKEFLSEEEYSASKKRIYRRLQEDIDNEGNERVIYVEDEADKTSENRTNLHYAVLNSKIEDIFALVEIHKQFNKPFTDINIRDKYGKTALDYAIKKELTLVIDYLKENTACQSVSI